MNTPGVFVLDVTLRRKPGVIACGLIKSAGVVAVVDPGPASTLDGLRVALASHDLGVADLDAILITHIHLDHSGVTGLLVRENLKAKVFVHQRGAPHLIDPSKLLVSAGRLYGDDMGRLWGEVLPVPAERVTALAGGEVLTLGGRTIDVAYTPGHASHHVSYFDRASGVAFVGDTGGIRAGTSAYLVPPTPPPDIDIELWNASLDRIAVWHPSALFLTHFGLIDDAQARLGDLKLRLAANAALVRESFLHGSTDAEQMAWFVARAAEDIQRSLPPDDASRYEAAVPLQHCWMGLARYWRKGRRDRKH